MRDIQLNTSEKSTFNDSMIGSHFILLEMKIRWLRELYQIVEIYHHIFKEQNYIRVFHRDPSVKLLASAAYFHYNNVCLAYLEIWAFKFDYLIDQRA